MVVSIFRQLQRSRSSAFSVAYFSKHIRKFTTGIHSTQEALVSDNSTKETKDVSPVNPLDHDDYFNVDRLVDLKELFDARVHLGHHEGAWDPLTKPYIYGQRATQHIIDLNQTVKCLKCALNVLSHIVYRRGIVLFMSTNPRFDYLIQRTARSSGEYFVTREWQRGILTNSNKKLETDRLPDMIIAFNLSRFERIREAITEAAMCNIPVIGIIDSDCDPRLITYPVPGNDDTLDSVNKLCSIFKDAILKAKEKLEEDERELIERKPLRQAKEK